MSAPVVGVVVFMCVLGGALLGVYLRGVLPEHHRSAESKDLVRLATGLLATMSALSVYCALRELVRALGCFSGPPPVHPGPSLVRRPFFKGATMNCPRCQHDNRPGAKFCEECAAPLGRRCTNSDAASPRSAGRRAGRARRASGADLGRLRTWAGERSSGSPWCTGVARVRSGTGRSRAVPTRGGIGG